jgi:tRNA (guanine37-N1)-methyltransferase
LMWWELPAMVFIETVWRLIPGVIKEKWSYEDESYSITQNMENIEYPQYTMPQEVYWYKVPDILLSGHHKKIEERRKANTKKIDNFW